MSWESIIDQMKEWVEAQNYLTTSFIDRGDPAPWDFQLGDFIRDQTWRELDISAIVPANAKAIAMSVEVQSALIGRQFETRKVGIVWPIAISIIVTQIANERMSQDFICPVDSNQKIEYWVDPDPWTFLNLTIRGWWL